MSDSSWLKDLEWVLTPSGKLICTCTELVLIWLISFGPQCQSYNSLMRCYAFVLARAFVWPINKWHQPIIIQLCGWLSIQMCTASRLRPINLHVHSNDMADYYILRPYYVCRPYHSNGKRVRETSLIWKVQDLPKYTYEYLLFRIGLTYESRNAALFKLL